MSQLLEEGLHAHLVADAGLVAQVATRIYPNEMPQKPTYPAIVYQRISGPRIHSHQGASGLVRARMQFTCWGRTYGAARTVADKLRLAIDGYQGLMGQVNVNSVLMFNDWDDFDSENDAARLHSAVADYIIWYNEPQPDFD